MCLPIPRFVVVLDQEGARYDVADVAVGAIQGGADVVQVREKQLPEQEVAEIVARVIAAVGDPGRVAVNSLINIAAELGTHLHLPEGLDLDRPRMRVAQGACLSRSIHGPTPILDADYAVLGNVLPTKSKPGKPPLGFPVLAEIAASCPCPVLAIGGIEPGNIKDVMQSGGYGVAVRSFVIESQAPERAARAIRAEIDRWAR